MVEPKPHCGVCRNWKTNCICPMEDMVWSSEEGPLRIVAAAVEFCDHVYAVEPPARHHNVLHMVRDQYNVDTEVEHRQGFLLSDGKFMDRKPATKVAREAGQLIRGDKDEDWPLTSEDLW